MNSNFLPMLPLQLVVLFSFISILLPPLVSTALVAKPGCPDRCGNLSIPYPFGIGSSCSLDPSFTISCNTTSTGPPRAYITIIDKEVIEINETYVRVKYPNYLASSCYGLSDNESYGEAINLSRTQYTLSRENWLTAIGCDDTVEGMEQPGEGSLFGSKCASLCAERNDTGGIGYCPQKVPGTLFGNGCCRIPITGDSTFLSAQLTDLSGALSRRRLFPCSYAFIQETGSGNQTGFSYSLDFLYTNSEAFPDSDEFMPPIVQLDWRIGYTNCSEELTNDPSYACQDRSICSDLFYLSGYVCSCFLGYKGNPYLVGGCEAFSSSVAKPGCLDYCGNVSIPYPFGVGPECYKDPSFDVSCNLSSTPPTPYLSALSAKIFDLNLSQIQVNYPKLAIACYDQGGEKEKGGQSMIIDLTSTQFTLSTKNVITAGGCEEMVVTYGGPNRSFVGGSCVAFCTDSNWDSSYAWCPEFYTSGFDGSDSYMSGFGCCQASISKGTAYLEVHLSDLSGQWRRKKLYPCSFALVAADTRRFPYSYPLEYLDNSTAPYSNYPSFMLALVLDWRIGVENCKQAQSNPTTFACQENSVCVDFDKNVGGYICNCLEGYVGNPYLAKGCQVDIDECADDTTNQCLSNAICTNTPGSYYCSCSGGYFGDGRKNSTGCIRGRDVLKLKMHYETHKIYESLHIIFLLPFL